MNQIVSNTNVKLKEKLAIVGVCDSDWCRASTWETLSCPTAMFAFTHQLNRLEGHLASFHCQNTTKVWIVLLDK